MSCQTEHAHASSPLLPEVETPVAQESLPAWVLDFQQLNLSELCRRCVTLLPARLGYRQVSLYLHDPESGALTLAEASHGRPLEAAVPLAPDRRQLMTCVAQSGQVLRTDDVQAERRRLGLDGAAAASGYSDGACLIGPLIHEGELCGVVNLSGAAGTAPEPMVSGPGLERVLGSLARAVYFARAYERARAEARIDVLTGLYNRRWMLEAVTKEIGRAERFNLPLALIMADLDGLKPVNDRYGHGAGDALLRHIARRIVAALRQFDSAARVGGDEFVILLPATTLEGGRNVARRVLEAVRADAALYRGIPLRIRASLGVVQWERDWSATQMMDAADQAMYAAKRQGRDQIVCQPSSEQAMPEEVAQRLWAPAAQESAPAETAPAQPAPGIAGI